MMRRMFWFGFVLILTGGCGPRTGDVMTLRSVAATVYLDRPLFDTAAQLERAGSEHSAVSDHYERIAQLFGKSRVRVLECVPGGYKVVVEEAYGWGIGKPERATWDDGKVGWMLAKDLK
jgi:hypothetical protein